jgi:hypothetical protein
MPRKSIACNRSPCARACVKHLDRQQGGTLILNGKTGHRIVSLPSATIRFFEEQSEGKIANAPIFSTEYGQPWNKDSWKNPFKNAIKAARLPSSA